MGDDEVQPQLLIAERSGDDELPGAAEVARVLILPSSLVARTMGRVSHRIFDMPFASVYPMYVQKAERKGRTRTEVDEVIAWLTGFDEEALTRHLDAKTTFADFFAQATLNPRVDRITGMICGVRVEQIEDPLMQQIRYLDKLVDDLAKGRPMAKVLREDAPV